MKPSSVCFFSSFHLYRQKWLLATDLALKSLTSFSNICIFRNKFRNNQTWRNEVRTCSKYIHWRCKPTIFTLNRRETCGTLHVSNDYMLVKADISDWCNRPNFDLSLITGFRLCLVVTLIYTKGWVSKCRPFLVLAEMCLTAALKYWGKNITSTSIDKFQMIPSQCTYAE